MKPRIGVAEGDTAARETLRRETVDWRAWYKTAEWGALRKATFVRDAYACVECGRVTVRPVCNHKIRHMGRRELFFEPTNLETVCKACHDSTIQARERADALSMPPHRV